MVSDGKCDIIRCFRANLMICGKISPDSCALPTPKKLNCQASPAAFANNWQFSNQRPYALLWGLFPLSSILCRQITCDIFGKITDFRYNGSVDLNTLYIKGPSDGEIATFRMRLDG